MDKPKLTLNEHNIYARTGKIPESFQKRREEYKEWKKKQEAERGEQQEQEEDTPKPVGEQESSSEEKKETDESADNDFDSLPEDTEFPYNYGGSMFFLSDGTKVRGEAAAKKAQAALDEEE